jgi:hypothetical protein
MATYESLVFAGTELNDTTNYLLEALDCQPPGKRPEWISGADADGAALVRDPLFENRTVVVRVRVAKQATTDLALAKLGALVDKIEEADKQPDGLALVWTPAGGTKSVTFYVLSGEVTGLPITTNGDDSGWFQSTPVVTLTLTCKPFGYGSEVTLSPVTAATPVVTLTAASVTGDVPAEARLIVTDNATQNRAYLEWGLEQRYYDVATSLLLDSDSLTTTGLAGAQTTRTGAYDPNATGNNVIRATLATTTVAVCSTGAQSHVGTFRVKARVYATSASIQMRLSWQDGSGPYSANGWQTATLASAWTEVDLGLVTIAPAAQGTQTWVGLVEAYTTGTGAGTDTIDVDYLVLVPAAEGYGAARAPNNTLRSASTFIARDEFNQAAGVLNAKTAPTGGAWATVGAGADFSVTAGHIVQRTAVSDTAYKIAVSGVAATTTQVASVDVKLDIPAAAAYSSNSAGAVIRYVDANNWIGAQAIPNSVNGNEYTNFSITKVVGGVFTNLVADLLVPIPWSTWATIALQADTQGRAVAWIYIQGSLTPVRTLVIQDTDFATGGALASGKPGFFDGNFDSSATTRNYDNFKAWVPPIDAVMYSTQSVEVRADSTVREDSSGTYYGPVPQYRGSRFLLPPAGSASRTSRVLVKAHRDDITTGNATNVTDSLTAQIKYTPRYVVVPR